MVTINRAVTVALADGPHVGLLVLASLDVDERLERYQPRHAVRTELLTRSGDTDPAADAYRKAIALTENAAERRALEARAARF